MWFFRFITIIVDDIKSVMIAFIDDQNMSFSFVRKQNVFIFSLIYNLKVKLYN